MSKELISGAEALMRSLQAEGVDTIFGYPGGAIMPVFDALYDYTRPENPIFNHILVRHEQAAAHAAEGYARVSGKVGVCLVTSGPGATNTITGIADAMMDNTPIVVIAGQVGVAALGSDAFQEVDLVGITQPISKWSYQIRRPEDVAWAVSQAFYIASTGRPGPGVLDFPKNAQVNKFEYEPKHIDFIRSYNPYPKPTDESVKQAADLINQSKKPLVLVGQGVELAGARKELTEFVEKAGLPFASTVLGLSALPSSHPLNMGMLGMHGNLGPNVKTQEADLIIAVGMRFSDRVTGRPSTYAKQAKIIHFDIDKTEFSKNIHADVTVLGNCKETIPMVTALLEKNSHSAWAESFKPYDKEEFDKVISKEVHPTDGPIKMGEVISKVTEATQNKAVLVTDVGQNQMMGVRYFKYSEPRSVVTSGGLGTMGFGLPAAIGATFGAPDRMVCFFSGDGGLQMTIEELGTIMEQKAPVKIILLNNNYLGNVRQWQEMFFNHRYSFTPMMNPKYDLIAKAYDINYSLVTDRSQLDNEIQKMVNTPGAYLLEVAVIEECDVLPMTPPGASVNEMVLEIKR